MNVIGKVPPLRFYVFADLGGPYWRAETPFGPYGYYEGEDEGVFDVYSNFEHEGKSPFVKVGTHDAAREVCGTDYARRLHEALDLAWGEE